MDILIGTLIVLIPMGLWLFFSYHNDKVDREINERRLKNHHKYNVEKVPFMNIYTRGAKVDLLNKNGVESLSTFLKEYQDPYVKRVGYAIEEWLKQGEENK